MTDRVVFLISLKAGGSGAESHLRRYGDPLRPWWNPARRDQASDRAHRIGPKKVVTGTASSRPGRSRRRSCSSNKRRRIWSPPCSARRGWAKTLTRMIWTICSRWSELAGHGATPARRTPSVVRPAADGGSAGSGSARLAGRTSSPSTSAAVEMRIVELHRASHEDAAVRRRAELQALHASCNPHKAIALHTRTLALDARA